MASKIPGFTPGALADPAFVRRNAAAIQQAAADAEAAKAEEEAQRLRNTVVCNKFTLEQLHNHSWFARHGDEVRAIVYSYMRGAGAADVRQATQEYEEIPPSVRQQLIDGGRLC